MNTPSFHPFAACYQLKFPGPTSPDEHQRLVTELLNRIGHLCHAESAPLIGHIKALAVQPGGGYMAASLTSAQSPAQVETGGLQTAEQLDLSLAVLVYGLERDHLIQILDQTWQKMVADGLIVSVRPTPPTGNNRLAWNKTDDADALST